MFSQSFRMGQLYKLAGSGPLGPPITSWTNKWKQVDQITRMSVFGIKYRCLTTLMQKSEQSAKCTKTK